MEPILSIRNLEHRRSNQFTLAVERLDFQAGRVYYLTGANGAGKSTLLLLLSLLLPPERGEVLFAGTPVKDASQRQRFRQQITLVAQAPFLFDTSVYNNLAFGLRLRDVRGDLQRLRIVNALEAVGLVGFESRQARSLSGGESQRVALARALVLQPKVLLLDEPTDGLDRDTKPLFERCLAQLPGKGVTVILASHDSEQPLRLPGELVHLEAGRLTTTAGTGSMTDSVRESTP